MVASRTQSSFGGLLRRFYQDPLDFNQCPWQENVLMREFLSRFKLTTLLLVIAMCPVVYALLVGGYLISGLQQSVDQDQQTLRLMEVTRALDRAVDANAAERGISMGYLASKGGRFVDELRHARQQSDEALQQLRQQLADVEQLTVLARIPASFELRAAIRSQVDQLDSKGVFAAYSQLNGGSLDGLRVLINRIPVETVREQAQALLELLSLKENTAQLRGLVNGMLSANHATPDALFKLLALNTEDGRLMAQLELTASPDLQVAVQQWRQGAEGLAVKTMLDRVRQQGAGPYSGLQAGSWFNAVTAHIQQLSQLSATQLQSMMTYTRQRVQSNQSAVWIAGFLAVSSTILLIGMSCLLIRITSQRVRGIEKTLTAIAEHQDLTLRICDPGQDELAHISTAVDNLLQQMVRLLGEIHAHSVEAQAVAKAVDQLSGQGQQQAAMTHQHADQIAAAVTQMAQSSVEVARHTQQAATDTQAVRGLGAENRDISRHANQLITTLSHEIKLTHGEVEQLAARSQQIGSILDTISAIAEQTNLLALNAAIEAARAGEQGRGFAVVADEVRQLASKSQGATEEIRTMIAALQQGAKQALEKTIRSHACTEQTAEAIGRSEHAMVTLFSHIDSLSGVIGQIAESVDEQTRVAQMLNEQVEQVALLADGTRQVVIESHQQTVLLDQAASLIHQELAAFRLQS